MQKVKRVFVFLLSIIISVTFVLPLQVKVNAYSTEYPNTWNNTGNSIEDIIGIAMTQVGYYGTTTTGTKYGAWYGDSFTYAQWCGMFVAWCADQAGIPTSVIHKTAKANNYRLSGTYHYKEGYTPKRGDLALYNPMTNGYSGTYYWPEKNADGTYSESSHVAIVCSYDSASGKVWVVSGNSTDSKVCFNSVSLSSNAIQAFVTPSYSSENSDPTGPSAPLYDYVNGNGVRLREGPSTDTEIIASYNTGTSVEILETVTNDAQETWYKVNVISTSKIGYIRSDFVTVVVKPSVAKTHYINGDNVRLRKGPSTDTEIINKFNNGESVEILETVTNEDGEKWYKVKVISTSEEGYIISDYITIVEENDDPVCDFANTYYNLRSAPGTWNSVVGSVSSGAKVEILEVSYDTDGDKWYYINVIDSSVKGYIYYKRVTVNSSEKDTVSVNSSKILSAVSGGTTVYTAKKGDTLSVLNITYDGLGTKWLRVKLTKNSTVYEGYIKASDVSLNGVNRRNVAFTTALETPKSGDTYSIDDTILIRGWAFSNVGEAPCFYSIDGGAKTPFNVEKRTDVKANNSSCTTNYSGFTVSINAKNLSYGEHTLEVFSSSDVTVQRLHKVTFNIADKINPTGELISVTDIDKTGYTIIVSATDNEGISSVYVTTQANEKSINSIAANIATNLYSIRIKTADYGTSNTNYFSEIYVRDTYGNVVKVNDITINPEKYTPYIISFNANGGSNAPQSVTATFDGKAIIPQEVPIRYGYRFMGWSTTPNGQTTYSIGNVYTFKSSVTLYAVWTEHIPGDCNDDDLITTSDLAVMKLALSTGEEVEMAKFDFDGDNKFDTLDLAGLKLYLAE